MLSSFDDILQQGMAKHLEALETGDCIPGVTVIYTVVFALSFMLVRIPCIEISGE